MLKEKIKEILEVIEVIWTKLPSEVKAAIYLTVSYFMGELIVSIQNMQIDSVFVSAIVNILLVFLVKLRGRIPFISEKIKSVKDSINK